MECMINDIIKHVEWNMMYRESVPSSLISLVIWNSFTIGMTPYIYLLFLTKNLLQRFLAALRKQERSSLQRVVAV